MNAMKTKIVRIRMSFLRFPVSGFGGHRGASAPRGKTLSYQSTLTALTIMGIRFRSVI
jgi:hypothetical protein